MPNCDCMQQATAAATVTAFCTPDFDVRVFRNSNKVSVQRWIFQIWNTNHCPMRHVAFGHALTRAGAIKTAKKEVNAH